MMIIYDGFVSDRFGNEIIISFVKDKQGDLCNVDNDCGIILNLLLNLYRR